MVTRRWAATGVTSRGWNGSEQAWWDDGAEVETLVSEGSFSDNQEIDDAVADVYTGSTVRQEYQMNVGPLESGPFTYESLDPDIATVDASGRVSRVSDGAAKIRVTSPLGAQKLYQVPVADTGGQTTYEFENWVAGSLAKAIDNVVDAALAAAGEAADAMPIFSSRNGVTGAFTRNANLWLGGDWLGYIAGYSAYNSDKGYRQILQPIAARFLLGAYHYGADQSYVGKVLTFVEPDGTVLTRTIVADRRVSNDSNYFQECDMRVCQLDSDLPDSITPMKLCGTDFATRFGQLPRMDGNTYGSYGPRDGFRVPAIGTNQDGKLRVVDISYVLSGINHNAGFSYHGCSVQEPTEAERLAFHVRARGGDSGSGVWVPVDGEAVLLFVHTYPTSGSFTGSSTHQAKITAAMAQCETDAGTSTGQTFEVADFSGFNDYS